MQNTAQRGRSGAFGFSSRGLPGSGSVRYCTCSLPNMVWQTLPAPPPGDSREPVDPMERQDVLSEPILAGPHPLCSLRAAGIRPQRLRGSPGAPLRVLARD